MKKQLLILVMMLLPLMASADAIEIEGIWYNLISEGKIAEVTRMPSGGYSDTITIIRGNNTETIITSGGSYSGTIEIPSKVTHNSVEYAVMNIGDDAFNCSSKLTSITIPNSVTKIGNRAFRYCGRLPSITIPNSVTTIGNEAFENCSSLSSVNIPNSVTSIGSYAFDNCTSLASIAIPDGVATIEICTFRNCSVLTSVIIPEKVTSIGLRAFSGCGITSIHLPSTITSIGDDAFDCDNLVRVVSDMVVPPASSNPFNSYTYNEGYLIVPKDAKFEYETTNGWKQFATIYEAGSEEKTDFTITIEQEGTLSDAVENLEASLVENLTIKGRLNGKDIAYLISKKGKVAHLNSLDLKDVTLVSDNTMYNSISYGVNSDGASTETTCYYLSDENYKKTEWQSNGLGGSRTTIHYYNNYLAGAFHDMNLKKIVMPASITQIGERTFQNNTILEEVWFPESVTSIGGGHPGRNEYAGAFYQCSSLTTIPSLAHIENIEEAAFAYCTNIMGEIDLSTAKTVKENAFYACSGISSVKFSSKLESVDGEAFAGCSVLSDIYYDENADVMFSRTSFSNTPWNEKLPTENGIVYMGKVAMAVEKGTEPRELTFREGTVSIAHDFFDESNFEKIRTVNLPNSVKHIGDYAFNTVWKGSNVEFINLPEGLVDIGYRAFASNKRLQKLALPNTVKYVGDYAFSQMEKLQSVENYNASRSGQYIFYDCELLESVKIGPNVETISKGMFNYCEKLAKVEFEERGNSLPLSIEEGAFSSCESIIELILPEGVGSIGKEAFSYCANISSLSLPNSLQYIGERAFYECRDLKDVYCYAKNVPSSYSDTFISSYIRNATLHVPSVSIDAYKSSDPWKYFGSIVKIAMPEHTLTYMVDGEIYKTYSIEEGETITPEPAPTKEGYTFSGWSEIPETMPAHDVTVTGTFTQVAYEVGDVTYEVNGDNASVTDGSNYSGELVLESTVVINDQSYAVTTIADAAFKDNQKITSVTIPNSVTSIGASAFEGCNKLSAINIGKAVASIGSRAFANMSGASQAPRRVSGNGLMVQCNAESVPSTASDAFANTPINNATLLVLDNLKTSYMNTAPWSGFGKIMGINEYTGIEAIIVDIESGAKIYSLDGKPQDSLQKGVNIVRMKNGTMKKVVVK